MLYRLRDLRSPVDAPLPLRSGENVLGSHAGCDLVLDHPAVSRYHAVVVVGRDRVELADLGSENGTTVDGRRVRGKQALSPGDRFELGTLPLVLEAVADQDAQLGIGLEPDAGPAGVPPPAPPAEPTTEPTTEPTVGPPAASTASVAPLHRFTADHLSAILSAIEHGDGQTAVRRIGTALATCFAARRVEIRSRSGSVEGILYRSGDDELPEHRVSLPSQDFVLEVDFLHGRAPDLYRPLLGIALQLLALGRSGRSPRDGRTRSGDPQGAAPAPPPFPPPQPRDPAMQSIVEQAAIVARSPVTVLVRGETGTGKELLARYLHDASAVASGPFVALNCAAIPRDLQEAELFGIEKGVATGVAARPGTFELAHGGTLFLDEIGDMAPETQARILRVLQEGEVCRLGSSKPRPARARIVSATHRDLSELRREGLFRDDLYHRLSDWEVEIPALRDRRIDVPHLASHFLARAAREQDKRIRGISRRALELLEGYDWPGNVRQLEREIARASLFVADGGILESGLLSEPLRRAASAGSPETLQQILDRAEAQALTEAWQRYGGKVREIAEALSVPRSTLYRKLRSLRLPPED